VRAERRVAEAGGDVDEIEAAIAARDAYDSSRADSPLVQADGSRVVDTTGLSIDAGLSDDRGDARRGAPTGSRPTPANGR
jgi:cytidylate kinase